MLNRLKEFAVAKGLQPERGFAARKLHWILELSPQGEPRAVIRQGLQSGKRFEPRVIGSAPEMPNSYLKGGKRCHFLLETSSVVLNLPASPDESERIQEKHQYFVSLVEKARHAEARLWAVAALLGSAVQLQEARRLSAAEGVKANELLSFSVDGVDLLGLPSWRAWWTSYLRSMATGGGAGGRQPTSVDLLDGEECVPLSTHPLIRGMTAVGGNASALFVSFDKEALESYGYAKAHNAPLSEKSASTYADALNHLIREHSTRVGDMLVLHWFDRAVAKQDDPFALLESCPEAEEADALSRSRELLRAIQTGQHGELADYRYFALFLSGADGRVMVRDWMEGGLGELAQRVSIWFELLAIEGGEDGRVRSNFTLRGLAGECVAEPKKRAKESKDHPVQFRRAADALLRSALRDTPIPSFVAGSALAQLRREILDCNPKEGKHELNTSHRPERMALLRGYINKVHRKPGGMSMCEVGTGLDPEVKHPAYWAGCLLAVLAAIQWRALGDVGAGVVQRYYAAASATPGLVFGRLMRGAQPHLAKLEPGARFYYEDLLGKLSTTAGGSLPATLDLEGQTLFALGYYHQLLALRKAKQHPEQAAPNSEVSTLERS